MSKIQTTPSERQAFGLRIPRSADPQLRALRAAHQPTHQGWRLSSSTWLLLSYLEQQQLQGLRILEVGCGWGLAGVYCAHRGGRVISCDLDPEVLPIAQYHAQLNEVEINTQVCAFDGVDAKMLDGVNWVVGADICFRGDLIEPLFDLLARPTAPVTVSRLQILDGLHIRRWPAAASANSEPGQGLPTHLNRWSPGPENVHLTMDAW